MCNKSEETKAFWVRLIKGAHNMKRQENFLKNSMKKFGLFLSKSSGQSKLFICVRAFRQ